MYTGHGNSHLTPPPPLGTRKLAYPLTCPPVYPPLPHQATRVALSDMADSHLPIQYVHMHTHLIVNTISIYISLGSAMHVILP